MEISAKSACELVRERELSVEEASASVAAFLLWLLSVRGFWAGKCGKNGQKFWCFFPPQGVASVAPYGSSTMGSLSLPL